MIANVRMTVKMSGVLMVFLCVCVCEVISGSLIAWGHESLSQGSDVSIPSGKMGKD